MPKLSAHSASYVRPDAGVVPVTDRLYNLALVQAEERARNSMVKEAMLARCVCRCECVG